MNDDQQTAEPKVPSRTIGFSVMSVVIVVVATFLYQQQVLRNPQTEQLAAIPLPGTLPGFLPEQWYLADDPLLGFVEIPAGSFSMGSNPALDRMAYQNERWSNTRRQGRVDLPRYYISRYETSVAQFAAYLNAIGEEAGEVPLTGPADLPVTYITWPEALAYTRWLDAQLRESLDTPTELKSFLEAGGRVTLPSEAEWEKAARGTEGQVFPWRNAAAEEVANFNGSRPRAVNALNCRVCAWGLSDMSGNVWEMTASPMQPYPFSDEDDMENLSEDAIWIMRGGSFADGLANIRAAVRGGVDPGVRNIAIGFRIAISAR